MIKLGNCEITRIEELIAAEDTILFEGWTPEILEKHHDLLVPTCFDTETGMLKSSIHTWLLKKDGLTILIDTGAGNHKDRPLSPRFGNLDLPYLERLAAAGVQPDDVDHVILTHLHIDHVGWNTVPASEGWEPTFKNATYWMSRIEREWRDPELSTANRPAGADLPFVDSVKPVLDAGMVKIVEGDEQEILPGIDLMPIPGHAPGMMAVRVRSQGEEALFIGDVMHQPLQIYYPNWNSRYCEDKEQARKTRHKILEYSADNGNLILPAHFGAPFCGRVVRDGDGYAYVPSEVAP